MSRFLNEDCADDLMNMFVGAEIGRGQYRVVYEHALDSSLVIKQDTVANFSNAHELAVWQELGKTEIGKWLAPVKFCSHRGIWLVQAKTSPIEAKDLPKKVPAMFCDMKAENWGLLDGRPVCHDYGNHRLFTLAKRDGKRLRKANW